MVGKPSISFFAMNFILLFVAIGLILIVFELHGLAFLIELIALLSFIFLMGFSMLLAYHGKKSGWIIIGGTLIFTLINSFFIALITKIYEIPHITVTIFSVAGLLVTLFNLIGALQADGESRRYEKTIEKTFTPGKYIASNKATKFHSPKCDWAKKISEENQIWFNSKEEAQAKGFEADKCVA